MYAIVATYKVDPKKREALKAWANGNRSKFERLNAVSMYFVETSEDVWTNVAIYADAEAAEKARPLAMENYREAAEIGILDPSSVKRNGGEVLFHMG